MHGARAWLPTIAFALACEASVDDPLALHEPIRVPTADFHEDDPELVASGPRVTSVQAASGILVAGQQGRLLSGRVSQDAYAIGVRLADLGGGWWVLPVQGNNPMFPEERDFTINYDVGIAAPPGTHRLRAVAIDEDGDRGEAFEVDVCVIDERLPDGLNACDPNIPPPAVIVSLAWDREVDLDLVVATPGGKRVRWKTPTTAQGDGGPIPADALGAENLGRLSRDSNADCVADGRNTEAVVWDEAPAAGVYAAYVDMFDACGETEASYSVAVYRRFQRDDGTWGMREVDRAGGTLLRLHASGGAKPPIFVLEAELP